MTEDELIEALKSLVAAGEYLDEIAGLPGVALDGGGIFQTLANGQSRRIYTRRSAEYEKARAAGLTDRLPPLPRATPEVIREAETTLGRPLPPLLKRAYLEVANGGFGPGYGLLGLRGEHRSTDGNAIEEWQRWTDMPRTLLPICDWGCAINSYVDLSTPDGRIWGRDPNPAPDEESNLFPQSMTLAQWFERWLDGKLFQPTLIQDESTGVWRGATDAEVEAMLEDAATLDEQ